MSTNESQANATVATPSAVSMADVAEQTDSTEEIVGWIRLAIEGAEDKLGLRTAAFFVGDILGITDWFIVSSGSSRRQVKAIVEGVEEFVTIGDGPKPLRIEGLDAPDWVLMDYGTFIVHVFTEEAREFYDLERLWSDVPRLESA